jgi:hypothetical protein
MLSMLGADVGLRQISAISFDENLAKQVLMATPDEA